MTRRSHLDIVRMQAGSRTTSADRAPQLRGPSLENVLKYPCLLNHTITITITITEHQSLHGCQTRYGNYKRFHYTSAVSTSTQSFVIASKVHARDNWEMEFTGIS